MKKNIQSKLKKDIQSKLKKDKKRAAKYKGNDFQGFFTYFIIIMIPVFFLWYWQGKNICLLAKNFNNTDIPNPFKNLYSHSDLGYLGYLKSVFTNVMNMYFK